MVGMGDGRSDRSSHPLSRQQSRRQSRPLASWVDYTTPLGRPIIRLDRLLPISLLASKAVLQQTSHLATLISSFPVALLPLHHIQHDLHSPVTLYYMYKTICCPILSSLWISLKRNAYENTPRFIYSFCVNWF